MIRTPIICHYLEVAVEVCVCVCVAGYSKHIGQVFKQTETAAICETSRVRVH